MSRFARASLLLVGCVACGSAQRPRPELVAAVRVSCEPPDARITLDEVDQGACVLWRGRYLGLTAGAHRLRIDREGYFPFERDVPPSRGRFDVRASLRVIPE